MKKVIRWVGIGLVVAFLLLQLWRPTKNLSKGPQTNDIAVIHTVPKDVQSLLARACYDCHSNTTKYPWYAEVQPVAWFLSTHVREGKSHLNFSEFGRYSVRKAASQLNAVADEVLEKNMPLASYTPLHPEARLTPEETTRLASWATSLADELAP